MPAPLPHAAFHDLDLLHPEVRASFRRLVARVVEVGLPLYVYETWRTPERQAELAHKGGSQLSTSMAPHPRRAAADFVLINRPEGGRWATGTRSVDGAPRAAVVDPAVFNVWTSFGSLIASEFPDLEWGGRWGYSRHPDQLIGWDPYHVQHKRWRELPYLQPEAFAQLPRDPDPSGGVGGLLLAAALFFGG